MDRRRDQECRRDRDAEQRDEVVVAVEPRNAPEPDVEWDDQQEREQNLDADRDDPHLVQHLDGVAVESLEFRLSPTVVELRVGNCLGHI